MKTHFEESIYIQVTAAQIGISKSDWDFAPDGWTEQEVKAFMQKHDYDILPIQSKDEDCKEYWRTTSNGNYDVIEKAKIEYSNRIYYLTELKDLLVKLEDSPNSSYFLSNHENINGLVSNVHLNSKLVYVYFYNLFSRCEIELGSFIKNLVSEKELIEIIEEKSANDLAKEVMDRYKADKKRKQENHFVEYLYLSQFEFILKKKKLVSALGYNSNTNFSQKFKLINKYRNWFAHPLNSAKTNLSKDFNQLHKDLEELLKRVDLIPTPLLKAYFETSYETNDHPKFKITIGQQNEKLDTYLRANNIKQWAFITAENPISKLLTTEENRARNLKLEQKIKKQKLTFFAGKGIPQDSNWSAENSYLILNLDKDSGIKLCEYFKQNAFVFGKLDEVPELVMVNHSKDKR